MRRCIEIPHSRLESMMMIMMMYDDIVIIDIVIIGGDIETEEGTGHMSHMKRNVTEYDRIQMETGTSGSQLSWLRNDLVTMGTRSRVTKGSSRVHDTDRRRTQLKGSMILSQLLMLIKTILQRQSAGLLSFDRLRGEAWR